MWKRPLTLTAVMLLASCGGAPNDMAEQKPTSEDTVVTETKPKQLMKWSDLTSRPLPQPQATIKTGEHETDMVDIWLPDGDGPYPAVIMIHGGCWQKAIADRTLMNYAAEDLRAKGLAVWNIEYRGVDEDGGGYPGTFLDVAKAADTLRVHAADYNLKTDTIAVIGHSAGGHLAAWLSTRGNIDISSPLYSKDPLSIDLVVNSGGLADLEASEAVTFSGCLSDIMNSLVGNPSETRSNVFSDTSPAELFPSLAKHISVNGEQDGIAPPILGQRYTQKASVNDTQAQFIIVPSTGHVELVSPGTQAFEIQAKLLTDFLE